MSPEQQRLFTMLEEVVNICDSNGIVYYLAGGTALGAIRHRGFIPWDDDIDLMMPRADWERFVEIARNGGLPANRILSCHELNIEYPHVFGRYTDVTSCAIHYNQMLGGTPEGFIIDIFVLDPVPDAHDAYQEHRETLSLYNDLSNPYGYSYPMSADKKKLERYARRVKAEGRDKVLSELAGELERYDPEDCDYLVMRWAAAPRLFRKELFAAERYEEFEGLKVRVPGKCADYLVQHYGDDWMYLPPEGGRVTHDSITFLDEDYQTVQNDYLPFIDVERTKRAILNRRTYHIRSMDDMRKAEELRAHICASFTRKVTLKRAESYGSELEVMPSQARFEELDGVFSEFYRWQLDPELEGREEYLHIYRYHHPILIAIGDELLRIALENLIHTNRVGKAARILRVRMIAENESSDSLEKAKRLLDAVRNPPSLLDDGNDAESLRMSAHIAEEYPENFSNRVFYLEELYRQGDFESLDRSAQIGLRYFPEAGEFAKYALDREFADAENDADKQAAFEGYKNALAHTTHVGIVQDVRNKAVADAQNVPEDLTALLEGDASQVVVQAVPQRFDSIDAKAVGMKTMQLLEEIDDICSRYGIERYLGLMSCRLALAYGGNSRGVPVIDVLVPANEMAHLASLLQDAIARGLLPNRAVDCWTTNGNHLAYDIDYVDKTTTYLQLSEGTNIAAHGVKVKVIPIRAKRTGKEAKRQSSRENGWEANGYEFSKNITPKLMVDAASERLKMSSGRSRHARKLFQDFSDFYGIASLDDNSSVSIRLKGGSPTSLDASYFTGVDMLEFGGRSYPAPRNTRSFLETVVGAGWEQKTRNMATLERFSLLSPDMAYEDLLGDLAHEGYDLQKLFALMRKVRLSMIPMANDLRIRNRAMLLARRSEARKRLYDELHPQESRIEELRASQAFDQLEAVYSKYEEQALYYLGRGLGLCPSKWHMDMLCEILVHKGKKDKAEKLMRLAPPEHYAPLG